MADLGSMIVHLSVDTSGIMTAKVELQKFGREAQYSLTKANQQMSLLSAKTQKLANSISNLSQKTRTFGYLTSAVVTAPIVAFGKSAITAAKDYEFAMAKIEGLAGIPETLVQEWSDAILKMAPGIGQAPQEMADALYFVSSAGFKGAEALDITAMASKAAATGMGKAADIADLLVSALNAYKTSGLDAARAMDIFTAAVREGKIEPDAFVRSLGPVISIAAELGVGLDQVTAGMAAMSLSGASAANTATFMRNIFMKLARPAKQVEEALMGMKTSSEELRRMLGEQGLMPTLEYLRKLTEQYGESIFDIFPEMRALVGVLKLVGENLEYNKKVFAEVAASTGDFALAFEVASSTLQMKFGKASATTKVAMIQLGQVIGQYVLPAVEWLSRTIKNLSDWLSGLNNAWRRVVLGVTTFLVAMGPVTLILSVLGYVIGGVVVAIGYLKGAYLKLTGATVAATAAQTTYNASVAASVGAQMTYTTTTTGATGATIAFGNAAKVAGLSIRAMFGIVGLVVGGITALIWAISKYNKKIDTLGKYTRDYNRAIAQEVYSLQDLFKSIKKVEEGTKERADAIAIVNDRYGKYLPNLLTEKSTLEDLAKAEEEVTDAMINRIATESLQASKATELGKQAAAQVKYLSQIQQAYIKTFGTDRSGPFIKGLLDFADEVIATRKKVADLPTSDATLGFQMMGPTKVAATDPALEKMRKFYEDNIASIRDETGKAAISFHEFNKAFNAFVEQKAEIAPIVDELNILITEYTKLAEVGNDVKDTFVSVYESMANPILREILKDMEKQEIQFRNQISGAKKLGMVTEANTRLMKLYEDTIETLTGTGIPEAIIEAEKLKKKLKELASAAGESGISILDLATIMKDFNDKSAYLTMMATNANKLGIEFDYVAERAELVNKTLKTLAENGGADTPFAQGLSKQLEVLPPNIWKANQALQEYGKELESIRLKGKYNIAGFDANRASLKATEDLFDKLVAVRAEAKKFEEALALAAVAAPGLFGPLLSILPMIDARIEETANSWRELNAVVEQEDLATSVKVAKELAKVHASLNNKMDILNKEIQLQERVLYNAATAANVNSEEVKALSDNLDTLRETQAALQAGYTAEYAMKMAESFGRYEDTVNMLSTAIRIAENEMERLWEQGERDSQWEDQLQRQIALLDDLYKSLLKTELAMDALGWMGNLWDKLSEKIGDGNEEWTKWVGNIIRGIPQVIELVRKYGSLFGITFKNEKAYNALQEASNKKREAEAASIMTLNEAKKQETGQILGGLAAKQADGIATRAMATATKDHILAIQQGIEPKISDSIITEASIPIKQADAAATYEAAWGSLALATASEAVGSSKSYEALATAVAEAAKMGFPALLGTVPAAAATVLGALGGGKAAVAAFAEGGIVPQGYPNDTFPAMLTSGEVIIPEKKIGDIDFLSEILDIPKYKDGTKSAKGGPAMLSSGEVVGSKGWLASIWEQAMASVGSFGSFYGQTRKDYERDVYLKIEEALKAQGNVPPITMLPEIVVSAERTKRDYTGMGIDFMTTPQWQGDYVGTQTEMSKERQAAVEWTREKIEKGTKRHNAIADFGTGLATGIGQFRRPTEEEYAIGRERDWNSRIGFLGSMGAWGLANEVTGGAMSAGTRLLGNKLYGKVATKGVMSGMDFVPSLAAGYSKMAQDIPGVTKDAPEQGYHALFPMDEHWAWKYRKEMLTPNYMHAEGEHRVSKMAMLTYGAAMANRLMPILTKTPLEPMIKNTASKVMRQSPGPVRDAGNVLEVLNAIEPLPTIRAFNATRKLITKFPEQYGLGSKDPENLKFLKEYFLSKQKAGRKVEGTYRGLGVNDNLAGLNGVSSERDLINLALWGDDVGFEEIVGKELEKMRIQLPPKYAERFPDMKFYRMAAEKKQGEQLTYYDLHKHSQQVVVGEKFGFDAENSLPNPIGPLDNVSGHLGQVVKEGANYILKSQDIWKFLPEDYVVRWGKLTNSDEDLVTKILMQKQAALLSKVTTPFGLLQTNPVPLNSLKSVISNKTGLVDPDIFMKGIQSTKYPISMSDLPSEMPGAPFNPPPTYIRYLLDDYYDELIGFRTLVDDLLYNLYNKDISNAPSSIIDIHKLLKSKIKEVKGGKFQHGGIVPEGYPNDTYPAYLSSGEMIVPANEVEKIKKVLIFAESPITTYYDPASNLPPVRSDVFIQEAENVRSFYERTNPNVQVDIVPLYNDIALMQQKLAGLQPSDDVIMMYHSGDEAFGVPQEEVVKALTESPVEDIYLGTCRAQKLVEAYYEDLKGKNVYFRPDDPWWGFNQYAADFLSGMFGRYGKDKDEPKTTPLQYGRNYSVGKYANGIDEVPPGYPNDTFPAWLSSGETVIPPYKAPEEKTLSFAELTAKVNELIFTIEDLTASTDVLTSQMSAMPNYVETGEAIMKQVAMTQEATKVAEGASEDSGKAKKNQQLEASVMTGVQSVVSTAMAGGDVGKAATGAVGQIGGTAISSLLTPILSSAIPIIGPILGPLLGGLFSSLFGSLFGGGSKGREIPATGLAAGGIIPQGFPNDSFPAMLTSGEVVLPQDKFKEYMRFVQSSKKPVREYKDMPEMEGKLGDLTKSGAVPSGSISDELQLLLSTYEINFPEEKFKSLFTPLMKQPKVAAIQPSNAKKSIVSRITNYNSYTENLTKMSKAQAVKDTSLTKQLAKMNNGASVRGDMTKQAVMLSKLKRDNNLGLTNNFTKISKGLQSNDKAMDYLTRATRTAREMRTKDKSFNNIDRLTRVMKDNRPKVRITDRVANNNIGNSQVLEKVSKMKRTNDKSLEYLTRISRGTDMTERILSGAEYFPNVAKMAGGGIVPPGYPNDSFPAFLSSGEHVLPNNVMSNVRNISQKPQKVEVKIDGKIAGKDLVLALRRANLTN